MESELILIQAECYRLNKSLGEMQSFLQQCMQKAGAKTPQELFDLIPTPVVTEGEQNV